MLTVLSVFGTRPEVIKMAPLLRAFEAHAPAIRSVTCATGQHRQMLDQALALFGVKPDYDLGVMQADQGLADLTASLLSGLERVVSTVQPDWILAVGDTTTVLAAALIAYYHRVQFGHVEAGLRTGDRFNPYPEEMNRLVADLAADAHFAPTERARRTLLDAGFAPETIHVTGNTVVDALLAIADQPYDASQGPLADLPPAGRIVLVTAHRRESFGAPFREICGAIRDLAQAFPDVRYVYPVHLNPHVREPVHELLAGLENVTLLEPLDYPALVYLMRRATLVLTDSGGLQEEAPTFGVPVLVMREATERPEGIEAGVARLVGTQRARIVAETTRLLCDPAAHAAMAQRRNPYGDGQAAARITRILLEKSRT